MRVRPAARDQLPVPAENRRWRHEQRSSPRLPGKNSAERRQERPISRRQLRTTNLTLEHPQLMPQKQNLDLLLPLRATPQNDQLEKVAAATNTQTRGPRSENDPPPPLTPAVNRRSPLIDARPPNPSFRPLQDPYRPEARHVGTLRIAESARLARLMVAIDPEDSATTRTARPTRPWRRSSLFWSRRRVRGDGRSFEVDVSGAATSRPGSRRSSFRSAGH
jgi:hypothetical protein